MALIEWKDSLSVKINEIDFQHKKLIDYLNELHEAMKTGKTKDAMGSILSKLLSYTKSHFSNEEKYFKQFNYPQAAVHIEEHEKFIAKVTDVKNRFDKGTTSVSIELIKFLTDWIQNHINETDKAYSDFFISKGLK